MTERPTIFSAPMVRAILADLKTQTRRLLKVQPRLHHYIMPMWGTSPPPNPVEFGDKWLWREAGPDYPDDSRDDRRCPYGIPGDRLWVREAFQIGYAAGHGRWSILQPTGSTERDGRAFYRATFPKYDPNKHGTMVWRSPIHMPRWASRLVLEITDVRCQPLTDITEADATAEGVEPFFKRFDCFSRDQRICSGEYARDAEHRASFAVTWDEINGDRALWSSNPWVWAITFRRLP